MTSTLERLIQVSRKRAMRDAVRLFVRDHPTVTFTQLLEIEPSLETMTIEELFPSVATTKGPRTPLETEF